MMENLRKTIKVTKDWRGGFTVAFSPDSALIAISGYKKFGLFSANTGKLLTEAQHTRTRFFQDGELIYQLSDIEFSPDGTLLITGGNDDTVKIWRIGK